VHTQSIEQLHDLSLFRGGRISEYVQEYINRGFRPYIIDLVHKGPTLTVDESLMAAPRLKKGYTPTEIVFLTDYIATKVNQGVLEECSRKQVGKLLNLFTVPKDGGESLRPVLNCEPVNFGIDNQTFTMETLRRTSRFFAKGMWATKWDLGDGYQHVPIQEEDRKLFCFQFNGKYYRYRVLPFGINVAPRVFSELMEAIVEKWRQQGLMVAFFIDDFIHIGWNRELVQQQTEMMLRDLAALGWIVKLKKSIVQPV
jgi:Reverse transcriptase (RNA-dependent DNA polymerase)